MIQVSVRAEADLFLARGIGEVLPEFQALVKRLRRDFLTPEDIKITDAVQEFLKGAAARLTLRATP